MVNLKREALRFLFKSLKIFKDESTEVPQIHPTIAPDAEPMTVYWESEKENLNDKSHPYVDMFMEDVASERIPDTTDKPFKESRYNYEHLSLVYLPEAVKRFEVEAVPEVPKDSGGISSSGRDAGVVAGIVVAVISGVIILAGLIAVVMYRHYVHRNVTSMNFDNPVYRKTTEDQFALEKNGYAPGSKLYPSTVGEEAQEPLTTPGTNEFV